MAKGHKVFICYYHQNDQKYCNKFERLYNNAIAPHSFNIGTIDSTVDPATIRQRIRDMYLMDSTVTVVLIGNNTWHQRQVDWEICSTISSTEHNPRSGLFGIILPTYHRPKPGKYYIHTIPPRLYDNVLCEYAETYDWSNDPVQIEEWVHEAYLRRNMEKPNNSRPMFGKDIPGEGWH